ncbi:MAG TPA: 3-hydroxyacyl-CoA dehydrogenase, partial [Cupriavidus sp.]|nr:3-hydroxyacyl-CoA dehydrogenase [Cupriavidus sp.]
MNLQDKVAIVTGAASGLGLATCKTLSAAGARVVGFDRDAGRLAESMGPDMTAVEVDVSDESSIRAGVEAALRKHGALHVAVNCAGVLGPCKTLSKGQLFPLDLWNQVLGVNLTGTFNVIRHAALA